MKRIGALIMCVFIILYTVQMSTAKKIPMEELTMGEDSNVSQPSILWTTSLNVSDIRYIRVADFTGDGKNDVIVTCENDSFPTGDFSEPISCSLVLFDGLDGRIVWERIFNTTYGFCFIAGLIEHDTGTDLVVWYHKPQLITIDTIPLYLGRTEVVRLNGQNGDLVWNKTDFMPEEVIYVQNDPEPLLLVAGSQEIYNSEGFKILDRYGIYALNAETGENLWNISTHGILWSGNIVIGNLSNGDQYVVVVDYGNISAYRLQDKSKLWEYSFLDHDFFSCTYPGIIGSDDGRYIAYGATKNATTYAQVLVVLDTTTGSEVLVKDLPELGILAPYLGWYGYFDGDDIPDYLVWGFSEVSTITIFSLSGANGSVLWQKDILIYNGTMPTSSPLRMDIDSDGLDDLLIVISNELVAISGKDGTTLWNLTLPREVDEIHLADISDDDPLDIVYVKGDAVFALSLLIEDSSDSIFLVVAIVCIVSIFVVISSVFIRNRRKRKSLPPPPN